ncbi:hypothetical protein, partial [Azohydromonas aeria]|uniref:hypothetical protein n=1 Tax=Azohydromonas aeria TaxID=2590212 RepID=UPI0012F8C278
AAGRAEAGAAAAAGPAGFAPAFAAAGAMAMPHPRDAFTLPALPRRGGDHLRPMLLGLLLGLACAATGWWVRGLWLQEQERHRVDQLLAGAAVPSSSVLPGWSVDTAVPLSGPDAGAEPVQPQPAVAQAEPVVEASALPPEPPAVPAAAEPQPPVAVASTAAPAAAVAVAAVSAATAATAAPNQAAARPARAEAAPRRGGAGSRPVAAAASPARPAGALRVGAGAPRAACSAHAKYALLQCMQQQCSQAAWRRHPQCQRLMRNNEISS